MKASELKPGDILKGWTVTDKLPVQQDPDQGIEVFVLLTLEHAVATSAWTEESPKTVAHTKRTWYRADEEVAGE